MTAVIIHNISASATQPILYSTLTTAYGMRQNISLIDVQWLHVTW